MHVGQDLFGDAGGEARQGQLAGSDVMATDNDLDVTTDHPPPEQGRVTVLRRFSLQWVCTAGSR